LIGLFSYLLQQRRGMRKLFPLRMKSKSPISSWSIVVGLAL
jgi:hypothetical protein